MSTTPSDKTDQLLLSEGLTALWWLRIMIVLENRFGRSPTAFDLKCLEELLSVFEGEYAVRYSTPSKKPVQEAAD